MRNAFTALILSCLIMALASPLYAAEGEAATDEGTVFTLWPLVDYRESPKEGYSNLSILGPLLKFQKRGEERDTAVRPLFYNTENRREETSNTDYLYPVASTETSPDVSTVQVVKLFQKNFYKKDEGKEEKGTMLFPFYISGKSEKYGPYTSVFPFYGDIYERFWRDEYHYVMFPLYGKTVKKGTTTRNYLYPIFSVTKGEKESGFQFWPLYGQSHKEGVYKKRFVLWPFYMTEEKGLDTPNPTSNLYLIPFYAASDSPQRRSRHYLWPFFGHTADQEKKQEEWDMFWPFWVVERGEKRNVDRWLPFYSEEKAKESLKRWYMWPIYRHEEINSDKFRLSRDRLLYFLYSDTTETWSVDGKERRKTALWPFFFYKREPNGVSALSIPAPVEPVFDREGIERNWAPLWRIYQQRWNEKGDSALSILWNLYWHERRDADLAYELFPLVSYRSEKGGRDLKILKGLIRYQAHGADNKLSFLWLPFGVHWGEGNGTPPLGEKKPVRSEP